MGSDANYNGVVTGDIIASGALPDSLRRKLPALLKELAGEAAADSRRESFRFSLVGGDGWQWYTPVPADALKFAVRFACLLEMKEIQTRCAIAIDEVDMVNDDLNESSGPAFKRSGQALDEFREDERVRCLVPSGSSKAVTLAMDGVGEMVNLLLQQWTAAQAQAIGRILWGYPDTTRVTQADVAEAWSPETITRQTVNRHLDRAHWPVVERTLERYLRIVDVIEKGDD